MSEALSSQLASVGRLTGVFGVKGWLKLASYTEQEEQIFEYSPWWLNIKGTWRSFDFDEKRRHNSAWIVHLRGIDDRDSAAALQLHDVLVDKRQFAELDKEDFYWHELIGLRVFCLNSDGSKEYNIGCVREIIETGANDVLVVEPDSESIDARERMVPYVPGRYVKTVNLEAQKIWVSWHIDD